MHNLIIEPNFNQDFIEEYQEDKYVKLAYLLSMYTDKYYNGLSKVFNESNKEKIIKLLMCLCIFNC